MIKDKVDFQLRMLAWFGKNGRDLPWRKTYTPYHIWISEIMLQQTPMERVISYFNRWVERFPDIATIAEAPEEEVLRYWEGLGYYVRAKNIHQTAKLLRDQGAVLPHTRKELLQLPGIGPYTAAALMSLAHNEDCPVVDANVERIFSRLFNIATPIKDRQSQAAIRQRAAALLPTGNARYFNQALMELGALICTPARPACDHCPVAYACESYQLAIVDERPVPGKSTEIVKIEMATGVLCQHGRLLIQKRPASGVWGSLWEFPGGRLEKGESPEQALVREYREETELDISAGEKIAVIKHCFTRYRVTLHCFACSPAGGGPCATPVLHEATEYRWVTLEQLAQLPFPAPHRQLIELLRGRPHGDELPRCVSAGNAVRP